MRANTVRFEEYTYQLRKNWFWELLVILIFAGTALLITTFFLAPRYQADATLIVNSRREYADYLTNDQITSSEKLTNTYAEIIKGRSVLIPVITNLNLDMSFEQLQRKVTATPVNNTVMVKICVEDESVERAEAVLKEILIVAPEIIIDAVEAGSVKTVEDAFGKSTPVFPNKALFVMIAACLGVIFVLVFEGLKVFLDTTYKNEREIEEDLELSVIGVIPHTV